jgi:protein subunit release factor B
MANRESAAPRTFSEIISQNLTHDPSGKDVSYGNGRHQAKGEDESMNVSEINISQEGMEEVHENRLGEQAGAVQRSRQKKHTKLREQWYGPEHNLVKQVSKTRIHKETS